MHIHLIDGTYELFRAYFGAPSSRNPQGIEVGAVRGLVASLVALLRQPGTTHVAIAFDHVIESFRNALFDGYKTGEGLEPTLADQFPLAEEAARALGLVVWPMVEFEADDALATFAARAAQDERVERVWLCSPDKDLAQCVVGTRVVMLDRRRDSVLDEAGVIAKFGVRPGQIPDFLGLVGDAADGIPGVPRWGAKSTAQVLQRWPALEDIPGDVADWNLHVRGATALADNLRARRDDAQLYKRLATLRRDVPLAEGVDDLLWRGAERAGCERLRETLGDDRFAARIPRFQDAA